MSSLPELQRQFLQALLRRESPGQDGPQWPEARLAIYRNNVRLNFHAALQAAFPLLLDLMGAEEFARMAWTYQRAHPSSSGNLSHAGEALPAFLRSRLDGTDEAHLYDVARLERAIQQVLTAADDGSPFEVEALALVPAARHGEIRFGLQPAAQVLATDWPVRDWWHDLQSADGPAGDRHRVDGRTPCREFVLVRRNGRRIGLQRLDAGDYELLRHFAADADLGAAVDAALDADAGFDLQGSLVRWMQAGLIVAGALPSPVGNFHG